MRLFISNFKVFIYAILIIMGIEVSISKWIKHNSFHSNIMSFSYLEKTNPQRWMISQKINTLMNKNAEFIQIGDSSGLYGVKPKIIMEHLNGATYINSSCCADTGYTGYRYLAERFLNANHHSKYLVFHMTPWSSPFQFTKGFAELLKDSLVAPQHYFYDNLPSMGIRLDVTNAVYYGKFQHEIFTKDKNIHAWSNMINETLGWVSFPDNHSNHPNAGMCQFNNYYDKNGNITFYKELKKIKKIADSHKVKLIILFNPTSCTRGSQETETIIRQIERFKQKNPDVYIPFPFITTWSPTDFYDVWHLREPAANRHSHDIGIALAKILEANKA